MSSMVPTNGKIPTNGKVEVIAAMSRDEALQCIQEIRLQLRSLRKLVYDLWEREGWRALGYPSFRQCIISEIPYTEQQIYNELYAAQIEVNIYAGACIGQISERHLRPLRRLPAEQQPEVWQQIQITAPDGKITIRHVEQVIRKYTSANGKQKFSSLIKPSDNWNFSEVEYLRVDEQHGHGYIPGEIYANCFWYYVKPNHIVIDPMAAAGMAKVVYDDRLTWMQADNVYDFQLHLFDLTPQSPHVQQHNLITSFPLSYADYIFLDLPYYGMTKGQYSDKPEDLANMNLDDWTKAINTIAQNCAIAQTSGGLCTIISPNYRDLNTGQVVITTEIIRHAWTQAGYNLYDKTYASRRIQQDQSTHMAILNNKAKEKRTPLTDIAEIITFRK